MAKVVRRAGVQDTTIAEMRPDAAPVGLRSLLPNNHRMLANLHWAENESREASSPRDGMEGHRPGQWRCRQIVPRFSRREPAAARRPANTHNERDRSPA